MADTISYRDQWFITIANGETRDFEKTLDSLSSKLQSLKVNHTMDV